jgi:mannose-6-phosphate isomerase-like protein (cupin superfamily)
LQSDLKPYKRRESTDATHYYMGSLLTFLAESRDTGGTFSLFELLTKPGNEPPPHIHHDEDELYYVLEGEASVYIGEKEFDVASGDCVFLPRKLPHAFVVRTDRFRMLFLTQPGGAEGYFKTMMGARATVLDLPKEVPTYSTAGIQEAIAAGKEYGLEFLGPDQVREMLPGLHKALNQHK